MIELRECAIPQNEPRSDQSNNSNVEQVLRTRKYPKVRAQTGPWIKVSSQE
jgi:hypothetical protein